MLNKELKEDDVKKLIKNFNKDFETNVNKNGTNKFLIDLYVNFINVNTSDATSKCNLSKLIDLEEKINETFGEKQKLIFDEWNSIQDEFICEITEQAFVYGYCASKVLDIC